MINILEEFANNNIHPDSRYFVQNSKYGRATERLTKAEEALNTVLSKEEKKLFTAYTNAQDELNYLSRTDKFIYGYRLGVLMTMEAYRSNDDIVTGGAGE